MKIYPAIAILEFSSIATGILANNEMLKKAPITVIKSGTVHNGKYLILIGGSVASVEESYTIGININHKRLIDSMLIPNVDEQLHNSLLGKRNKCKYESLGVIESSSVSTMVKATDAGVKGANVNIVEIRLADDIGGKSFALFNGSVEEVQAAVDIAKSTVSTSKYWLNDTVIPRLHDDAKTQLNETTTFTKVKMLAIEGSEV